MVDCNPASPSTRHVDTTYDFTDALSNLCKRLNPPKACQKLAEIVCREHINVHHLEMLDDSRIYALLTRCDSFRRPERVDHLAIACEACARAHHGKSIYSNGQKLQQLFRYALAIRAANIASKRTGIEVGAALRAARIQAISSARTTRAP